MMNVVKIVFFLDRLGNLFIWIGVDARGIEVKIALKGDYSYCGSTKHQIK